MYQLSIKRIKFGGLIHTAVPSHRRFQTTINGPASQFTSKYRAQYRANDRNYRADKVQIKGMTTKYGDLETTFGKFSIRLQSIKIAIFYSTCKFIVPK